MVRTRLRLAPASVVVARPPGRRGAARWRGARLVRAEGRPAGPTTRTVVSVAGSRLDCWDGLVAGDDGCSLLVRLIRCPTVALDITHEMALGGFDRPWAAWTDEGHATLGTTALTVAGGGASVEGNRLVSRLDAPAGEWAALVVAVKAVIGIAEAGTAERADPPALMERLEAAQAEADALIDKARLPKHHPERAADALAVLDACTYRATGATIASPTTSLPEAPGADRQFDYRYTWLRDAALAVSVAALLGHRNVAARYLAFVTGHVGPDGFSRARSSTSAANLSRLSGRWPGWRGGRRRARCEWATPRPARPSTTPSACWSSQCRCTSRPVARSTRRPGRS